MPHGDFWVIAEVFWLLSLCFLAALSSGPSFVSFSFKSEDPQWMLALSWEMETICAAMKEAFYVWQGLWAGFGIKRILGNNGADCGLGVLDC